MEINNSAIPAITKEMSNHESGPAALSAGQQLLAQPHQTLHVPGFSLSQVVVVDETVQPQFLL